MPLLLYTRALDSQPTIADTLTCTASTSYDGTDATGYSGISYGSYLWFHAE